MSDCTVNQNPNAEDLVDITLQTAEEVKRFKLEPRIALVSHSNFGSVESSVSSLIQKAVRMLHRDYPDLIVDGEMQANIAFDPELLNENFPFSKLKDKPANTLIFPTLAAANITQRMIAVATKHEIIGPILNGMNKPAHILRMGSSVDEIVNMIMIAVMDAVKKGEQ